MDNEISGRVLGDILETQRVVLSARVIQEIPWDTPALQRSAFPFAARYSLRLEDALGCALAEALGVPLLVGDPALITSLDPLTRLRPTLFLALVDTLFE